MTHQVVVDNDAEQNKRNIAKMIQKKGVDIMGVADMAPFFAPGADIPRAHLRFLKPYNRAVVAGLPWGIGDGGDLNAQLEVLALLISRYIWNRGFLALPVHGDEELDPKARMGLISLKALAKEAGLGWQGRSLLIINPKHGPLHRIIAVMTDLPLPSDSPLKNRCGGCSACVDACPQQALTLRQFEDHPNQRQDVLDHTRCIGDDTCPHCIAACPWL